MRKRIVSLLMALVMVFSLIPTTVFAEGEAESDEFRVVISIEGLTLGQGFYVEPRWAKSMSLSLKMVLVPIRRMN